MSSQSTLSDDDLFGEAAEEMREEVETHLDNAQTALPDATSVWQTNADNVLGALNGLRSALDADDAEEHLRQAKRHLSLEPVQMHSTTLTNSAQKLSLLRSCSHRLIQQMSLQVS